MRCAGHVACVGEVRNTYKTVSGKHEGKRPVGRPMCRWVSSIRMELKEIVFGRFGLDASGSG